MKFKDIKSLDVIRAIENATELFRNKKYQSKKFIEKFIGLNISRAGFYGQLQTSDNSVNSLEHDQVIFNSAQDVNLFIEGVVILNTIPVNEGAGLIVYSGYGILEVNNVVIYDGRLANVDAGDLTATHTGDVTGTTALTISPNAVSNTKLADMAEITIKGRESPGTGDPEDLSPASVRAMINVEDGATADQTDLEIKVAYQNVVDTVTQAQAEAGTSGIIRNWTPYRVRQAIEALAPYKTAAEIRTAVEAATDSNVFTDADHTKLNAITGTNTGDQDISGISVNTTAIATNTANITSNDTDIATNATNIAANTSAISGITSNVSTNLSEGTTTNTTVDVNSSDGTNATLAAASTSRAGVMTKAKFDEVEANNAKVGITATQTNAILFNTAKTTNATHTGEVTGSGALTIADDVVDEANLKVGNTPTDGHALIARSGESGGLKWEAVSGGTASPLTLKGDLYTYDTGNARLPVGTNGQALVADSTEATGLKWKNLSETPAVGGGLLVDLGMANTNQAITVAAGATIINFDDTVTGATDTNGDWDNTNKKFVVSSTSGDGTYQFEVNLFATNSTSGYYNLQAFVNGSIKTPNGAFAMSDAVDDSGFDGVAGTISLDLVVGDEVEIKLQSYNATTTISANGTWNFTQGMRISKASGIKGEKGDPGTGAPVSLTKTITLEEPVNGDNITIFRTDVAITVQEVYSVLVGSANAVVHQLYHHTARNSGSANTLTNSKSVSSQVGGNTSVLDDTTIPADSWVWVEFTGPATATTGQYITIDIRYTE